MVNPDKPEKLDERPRKGTDEDYRCIETAAGIETPNHQFRHRLARCIESWARWEPDYSDFKNVPVLKAVRQLRAHAEPLLSDLTYPKYTGDDQNKKARALSYGYALDWMGVRDVLDLELRHLVEQADITLEVMPPDTGGRLADLKFEMLIRALAHFYRRETGEKPSVPWDAYTELYCGAFFDFVKACCRAFAPKYAAKTNQALGKATQRALKKLPVSL